MTMHRVLLTLIVALGALSHIAEGEYIPIAVGDEWAMAAAIFSPTGKATECVVRRRIESAIEKDGRTYVRSRTWTVGMPKRTETTKLLRKDTNGVYSIDESIADSSEQIEVALPLKAGVTWQQIVGPKTLTHTVIGLETIEVFGKIYANCYHIHTSSADGSFTEDFWEAPRVGNVKSMILYGNGMKFTLTLEEFKAGNY
jgi:hypothetical protein